MQQVGVEPPQTALNTQFAAERWRLQHDARSRRRRSAANLSAAGAAVGGWDRQADRQADGRTDAQPLHKHSSHTVLAASIKVQVPP